MAIDSGIALDLVAKLAPNLRDLSFWSMSLASPLRTPAGSQHNLWAGLFEKLARLPYLHLNYLLVGMLIEDYNFVQFQISDKEKVPKKEFSGKNMGAFFEEIAEQIILVPRTVISPRYGPDDDEDMDDGDEDEEGDSDDVLEDDDE
jgi:hypothetical protein